MNDRPRHIVGRPPLFTAAQVKAWRAERELRRRTRTVEQMARDAGISRANMDMLLSGRTYGWVK